MRANCCRRASSPNPCCDIRAFDPLQDERIRHLQQYHPWFFHAPPDGEPVIQEIHITPRHGDLAAAHRG